MAIDKMMDLGKNASVIRELFEYGKKRKAQIGQDKVFDFSIGNPSVPCPKEFTDALKRIVNETDPIQLHAYTSASGDQATKEAICNFIKRTYGANASADLIYMTCGAAASLTISLKALTTTGDEVVTFAPFFPEYTVFTEATGARLVSVFPDSQFQLDSKAFEDAINENTKVVLINSPNNPTGAVFTEDSIKGIAEILTKKSEEYSHPIYILADEPYRELTYGAFVPYISNYYKNTIVAYSYSKSLSLPGERIGYISVCPDADEAKDLFFAICGAGRSLGFVNAPSLFQYAIRDTIGLTTDLSIYSKNRTLLYDALISYGFEVVKPDGAFYLFMKAPEEDANHFSEVGKKFELLLVPSDSFGITGYVRIAYCVSTKQIEDSLDAFRRLSKEYGLTK